LANLTKNTVKIFFRSATGYNSDFTLIVHHVQKETTMQVGIIMGSTSDWPTMKHAADMLDNFGIAYETKVVSAHRTPQLLADYANSAASRGLKVIIAGAGGAAHLPGMAAAFTSLPVLGVPVQSKALKGIDSLLSIVQMPKGVAVGTLAIGDAGAANAGLLAAQILATNIPELMAKIDDFRKAQTEMVLNQPDPSQVTL
jgi:5-(carboxyamino)imidazole ribonucleotide mutase